jgi:serine/threonine protein kinase
MGAVYLARHPDLDRNVAIKELMVGPAAEPSALPRFLQEARLMARTSHPNLVQVNDLEKTDRGSFIILENATDSRCVSGCGRARWSRLATFLYTVTHCLLPGLAPLLGRANQRPTTTRDHSQPWPENVSRVRPQNQALRAFAWL